MNIPRPTPNLYDLDAEIGLPQGFLLRFDIDPEKSCTDLERWLKALAKHLKAPLNKRHQECLDLVADAVHLQDWHILSHHLSRGMAFQPGEIPFVWMQQAKRAFFVLPATPNDIKVPDNLLKAYENFCLHIAKKTGRNLKYILDNVAAPFCGSDSWSEVCERSHYVKSSPLFSFGHSYGEWEFSYSPQCEQLYADLYDLVPDYYEEETEENAQQRYALANKILEGQPDFYPAIIENIELLWKNDSYASAEQQATAAVKSVESLMPANFKGTIHEFGRNGFFHSLLHAKMKSCFLNGNLRASIATARKMIRINPRDGMGIRYVVPLLLLCDEQNQQALKFAEAKYKDEGGGFTSLIKAFCCYANNDKHGFVSNILLALFEQPNIKCFLMNSGNVLSKGDDGSRGGEHVLDEYLDYLWETYIGVPGLKVSSELICKDKDYNKAEIELFKYWKGFWQRRDDANGNIDGWYSLRDAWHEELVRTLT